MSANSGCAPASGRAGGFSLVELMVVLALIGICSTLAAVEISSNDTKLRGFTRDLRFRLEKAKHEALARGVDVKVAFFTSTPPFDCNHDGSVNAHDRCYVLYVDRDDNDAFSPATDLEVLAEPIDASVSLASTPPLRFTPVGASHSAGLDLETSIRTDPGHCSSRCLTLSYPVEINHVGRIQVGQKEETCAECSLCGTCP
ncbi:MAG: GspH/FimT family pseudopilin [bacterium]